MKTILFSTSMVQAILAGTKTQTRRVIKSNHESGLFQIESTLDGQITGLTSLDWDERSMNGNFNDIHPKYQPGDVLWVRETFSDEPECYFLYKANAKNGRIELGTYDDDTRVETCNTSDIKWKPSIHMPREAARLFLRVTDVRAERLQDISEEDAIAEGITLLNYAEQAIKDVKYPEHSAIYADLWDSINGPGSWDKNQWVWVYTFERIEKPE